MEDIEFSEREPGLWVADDDLPGIFYATAGSMPRLQVRQRTDGSAEIVACGSPTICYVDLIIKGVKVPRMRIIEGKPGFTADLTPEQLDQMVRDKT